MRRFLIAPLVVAALAVAGAAAAVTVTVKITSTGFSPKSVTIAGGSAVTWKNSDKVNHQIVANDGSFASPVLKSGASYSHTFRDAGTFGYHDALKPSFKGTVKVTGPPPSVALGLSLPIVRYGTQISLSGVISSKEAGKTVTLWAQPFGQPSFVQIAVVQTTTGGAFGALTTPEIYTAYKAQWGSASSSVVAVQVAPRITLSAPHHGYFHTHVSGGRSFAGRIVYVQRLSRFGQWVSIRQLTLGTQSGRTFRLRLPAGFSRLRVVMTQAQAGPGYLASQSGTQPVRIRRR